MGFDFRRRCPIIKKPRGEQVMHRLTDQLALFLPSTSRPIVEYLTATPKNTRVHMNGQLIL